METNIEKENRLKRLSRATGINAFLALSTATVGLLTGINSLFSEAVHDAGDTLMHGSRYYIDNKADGNESINQKRFVRGGLYLLSGLATIQAVRLGLNLDFNSTNTASSLGVDKVELAMGTLVVGGNYAAYRETSAIKKHTFTSEASHGHQKIDMRTSAIYGGALIGESMNVYDTVNVLNLPDVNTADIAGVGVASYAAIDFFRHAKGHKH